MGINKSRDRKLFTALSERISPAGDALQNWYLQILNMKTGYNLGSVHTFRARRKSISGENTRDNVFLFKSRHINIGHDYTWGVFPREWGLDNSSQTHLTKQSLVVRICVCNQVILQIMQNKLKASEHFLNKFPAKDVMSVWKTIELAYYICLSASSPFLLENVTAF